jgi:hypothetical protein
LKFAFNNERLPILAKPVYNKLMAVNAGPTSAELGIISTTSEPAPSTKTPSVIKTVGDIQAAMRASGELPQANPEPSDTQPEVDSTSTPTEDASSTKEQRTPRIHFEGRRIADPRQQGPMLDSMLEKQDLARAQAEAEALASATAEPTTQPQTETTGIAQAAMASANIKDSRMNRLLRLLRLGGKQPATIKEPPPQPSTIRLTEPSYGIVRQGPTGQSPFMDKVTTGRAFTAANSGTVGEALKDRPSVSRPLTVGDVLGTTPKEPAAPTTTATPAK